MQWKHGPRLDAVALAATLLLLMPTCFAQDDGSTSADAMRVQAADLTNQGKLDEAIALFNKSLALQPNNWKTNFGLAVAYCNNNDFQQSKASAHRALELNPKFAPAWDTLGLACVLSNDLPGAEAAFNQCLALDPKHFNALKNLGHLYFIKKMPKEALKYFLKASKLPEINLPENKDVRDYLMHEKPSALPAPAI